jgi:hypothetical protein
MAATPKSALAADGATVSRSRASAVAARSPIFTMTRHHRHSATRANRTSGMDKKNSFHIGYFIVAFALITLFQTWLAYKDVA